MKPLLSFLLFLSFLISMSGCNHIIRGDGRVAKNEIRVDDFDELTIACTTCEIHFNQSEASPGLSVTTDENIIKMLDITQKGQGIEIKLKKEYKDKVLKPTRFIITANSKTLKEIDLAGKAAFNLDSPFKAEKLEINIAGSGIINLNDSIVVERLATSIAGSSTINASKLDISKLEAEIAGSGTYNLEGEAQKVSFEIAGKGKVSALKLKAYDIDCEVAGYGNMAFYATNTINLEIAGFSRIKYKGNPEITQEGFAFVRKVD